MGDTFFSCTKETLLGAYVNGIRCRGSPRGPKKDKKMYRYGWNHPVNQRIKNAIFSFLNINVGTTPLLLLGMFSVTIFIWAFYEVHVSSLVLEVALGTLYGLSMIALVFLGAFIDNTSR